MLRHYFNRSVYCLLILLVGGIGPLTYFDAFVPEHAHPYHLSLLEMSAHHHNPLPPATVDTAVPPLFYAGVPALVPAGGRGPAMAHFFNSGLADGYVLPGQIKAVARAALMAGLLDFSPTNLSTALPPPKKPPK